MRSQNACLKLITYCVVSLNFGIVQKECLSSMTHQFIQKGHTRFSEKVEENMQSIVFNFLRNCRPVKSVQFGHVHS